MRSGWLNARSTATRPDSEWPTSEPRSIFSASMNARMNFFRYERETSAGLSVPPKPGRSGAITRRPCAASGARLRIHTSAEEPSEAPWSRRTGAPLPASKWRTLRASTRILFGNIQEHAVDIGDAVLAQRARRSEELNARLALAPGERPRAQMRIVVAELLQAPLEGVQ